MNADVVDSIAPFVRWEICLSAFLIGLCVALFNLSRIKDKVRRRCSAGIDFLWTVFSGVSIVSALVVFGDFAWKGYVDSYDRKIRATWDQLAKIDGKMLASLNCPNGKPVAESQIGLAKGSVSADVPCVRASQIIYWQTQWADHTKDIQKFCPSSDISFVTRDYSHASDHLITASCTGISACDKARCDQEHDALEILMATHSKAGLLMKPDKTLSSYRVGLEEAYQLSMRELYIRTHPIENTTAFFVFIPLWALIFGMRLARVITEYIDPAGKRNFFHFAKKKLWVKICRFLKWANGAS